MFVASICEQTESLGGETKSPIKHKPIMERKSGFTKCTMIFFKKHTYHICRKLLMAWLQLLVQTPRSLECTMKSASNFLLELPKHSKTVLQTL